MILVGSSVRASDSPFGDVLAPSLSRVLGSEDVVVTSPGDVRGIAAVYNDFVREARSRDDCDALVLLHDDVEIVDPNFRAKVLAAVGEESVGVVGVIGGAGLRSIAWWDARHTAGRVFESRRPMDLGPPRADVDVVDGLLLVLSRRAFRQLSFDEVACPRFHGYDVDYCLQARAAGLRVTVRPIEVLHRTKGGFGDTAAFDTTSRAIGAKWSAYIRPAAPMERAQGEYVRSRRSVRRVMIGVYRRLRGRRRTSPVTRPTSTPPGSVGGSPAELPLAQTCLACGATLPADSHHATERTWVIVCSACGTGLTSPRPSRAVEGEGHWTERYGDGRLARRPVWFSEARKRGEWVQLFIPDGCLLEVGCGTGEFIKTAEDLGYTVYGCEPSAWAVDHALSLGVPVEAGFLSDWILRYPGLRPDAVCLWHVLEHAPEPLSLLKDVLSVVRPGGCLFLEVPNFASSGATRLGDKWDGAQPTDHFVQYTPEGLGTLLRRAGFEAVQLLPMSRRLYESEQNWETGTETRRYSTATTGRRWTSYG